MPPRTITLTTLLGTLLLAATITLFTQTNNILHLLAGTLLATTLPAAAWVHHDAPTQNLEPTPWTLATLLLPIFGIILYIVTREVHPNTP